MQFRRHVNAFSLALQDGVNRGCMVLFLLTIILLIYRHFGPERHDSNKCDALLNDGRWLDGAYENWQPPGCMMHIYNADDISTCLNARRLVFIGDSLTRQIFWSMAKKLEIAEPPEEQHTSFSFESKGVTIEFLWDPYLNSSNLQSELGAVFMESSRNSPARSPAIMLIGGGLWYARYMDIDYLDHYKTSIEDVLKSLAPHNPERSPGLEGEPQHPANGEDSLVVLAPVSTPLYNSLSPARAHSLTPSRIVSMNVHLKQLSHGRILPIAWSFPSMTAKDERSYQPDGLHVIERIASRMADVLLNLKCNAVLRRKSARGYPTDKSCCNRYEGPTWTQKIILNGSLALLALHFLVISKNPRRLGLLPSRKIAGAITVVALALCYCYCADRTQLFNKVQKQYSTLNFLTLCTITAMLGIISIRRSEDGVLPWSSRLPALQISDQPFLSRDQTDEWKGWMQFIILIYHFAGASKVLWIYKIIRLLVASYLFMSGYGHTMFFYKKRDFSLRRLASFLVRVNMLSCMLPYIMKTDYLFYYFAPLVSFWYIVIYITMGVANCKNKSTPFLTAKILVSAGLTTALIRTPGVFEMIFSCLEKSCNIHWDVKEWRFRLQLDAYIVYAGMLFAIASERVLRAFHAERGMDGHFNDSAWQKYTNHMRRMLLILAFLLATLFYSLTGQAPDKSSYNKWLPYVSALPIFAFVELRNVNRHMRNYYSSIFAWLGRHSLETFTLQYHIWLAADTKGLLALGVFDPIVGTKKGRQVDFVILTAIFLWVCWHVASATQTLTNWILDPSDGRSDLVADDHHEVEEGLPRTKSSRDVKNEQSFVHVMGTVGAISLRPASRLKGLIAGDLRIRLVLVLGILWLLNMTY